MSVAFKYGPLTFLCPELDSSPSLGEVLYLGEQDFVVTRVSFQNDGLPPDVPLLVLTQIGAGIPVRRDTPYVSDLTTADELDEFVAELELTHELEDRKTAEEYGEFQDGQ